MGSGGHGLGDAKQSAIRVIRTWSTLCWCRAGASTFVYYRHLQTADARIQCVGSVRALRCHVLPRLTEHRATIRVDRDSHRMTRRGRSR